MRLVLIFSVLIIFFSSCRKDRICTCVDSSGATVSQATFQNSTRKEAKDKCISSASGINCSIK